MDNQSLADEIWECIDNSNCTVLIPVVWSLFDIKNKQGHMKHEQLGEEILGSWNEAENTEKNSIPIPNTPKKPEMVGQPHVGNLFRQPLSQTSRIVVWHRVRSPGFGKLQTCLLSSFYRSSPLHVSTKENFTKEAVRWFGRQRWLWPSGMTTKAQFLGLPCERRAMAPKSCPWASILSSERTRAPSPAHDMIIK